MSARPVLLTLLTALLLGLPIRAEDSKSAPSATLRTGLVHADHRVGDLDGDGIPELLICGQDGKVRVWKRRTDGPGMAAALVGDLDLPEPGRSLLAVGDLVGTGGPPQLLVLSPRGMALHRADAGGGFRSEGEPLISRRPPRFTLRLGGPRFAEVLEDLNGDGRLDVIVPHAHEIELWLNRGVDEADGLPRLSKAAVVRTDLKSTDRVRGSTLSDQLECGFRIPKLEFTDVNGDGRPDLVVSDGDERAFHLQREDGSIPREPDRTLDLDLFRDTTPPAEIRPGRILAAKNRATLSMQDLDADGIPDYVIAHRRKIWVFKGTKDGPRFTEPSDILKTSEDISALLVLPLDEDGRPDLLLLRVLVPNVASILRGFFAEIEVEISAVGYPGRPGPKFTRTPEWKGELRVVLPAISEILKNPQALLSRLEETGSKFRPTVTADFDGDGTLDVALLAEDGSAVELWKVQGDDAPEITGAGLGSLFFREGEREWTLDRVLTWFGDMAKRRVERLTGGRPPDARIIVRSPGRYRIDAIEAEDFTGSGAAEILILSADLESGGEAVLDLLPPFPEGR
jgi:FG-GAP-like repeat